MLEKLKSKWEERRRSAAMMRQHAAIAAIKDPRSREEVKAMMGH